MDSEQAARDAAISLATSLDTCSWFASVGIAGSDEHPTLIIYSSRKLKKSELSEVPKTWRGFPVEMKELGRIVPGSGL
jgi:hypothetical protein